MFRIIPPKNELSYAEIGQSKTTKMALAKQVDAEGTAYQRIHNYMKCRDFLGDCLHGEWINKPVGIFGFKFDPTEWSLDKDKLRLLIKFYDQAEFACFVNNLDIPIRIEEQLGLQTTTMVEGPDNQVLIEASNFWQSTVFMISFYTFMLKCMCYKIENHTEWLEYMAKTYPKTVEGQYALKTLEPLKKLIPQLTKIGAVDSPSGWPATQDIGTIHNSSGFVSLTTGNEKYVGKNLYYPKIQQLIKEGK